MLEGCKSRASYAKSFLFLTKALAPKGLVCSYGLRLLSVVSAGFYFTDPESAPCITGVIAPLGSGTDLPSLLDNDLSSWNLESKVNSSVGPQFNTRASLELTQNFTEIFKAHVGLIIRFHKIPKKIRKNRKDRKKFKLNLHFVSRRQRLMYNRRIWAFIFLRDFSESFGLAFQEGVKVKKIIFLIDLLSSHSVDKDVASYQIRALQLQM